MSSVVAGFEYDIFISYRHNDNRSGWVTEFVKALQEELASTIKEPISVYFDTNPHDGLLETHNVDKSLEGKLKCLIFIPIISQTYCDSKSFAWQHEFCAFNKLAKEDQFGREIKLSNGNVTSRILPVKIHELDSEDKLVVENEIGGVLRAIDFIYKEPGVNRPLKSTDNKSDNHFKIDYNNQINRVANVLKEIVQSIHNPGAHRSLITTGPLVARIIDDEKKSIAVLPFANLSSDPEQEYFSDGITEDIITQISKIHGLKVISRTSIVQFKGTTKSLPEIASGLKCTFLLEGSVRKSGNQLRITAQLIDAGTDEHLWAETYDREMTDVFAIQSEIAGKVALELRTKLSNAEQIRISKKPTENLEVYNLYLLGRSHYHKTTPEDFKQAIAYYKRAIALDDNFALGYAALAQALLYRGAGYFGVRPHDAMPEAFRLANKALELDPALSDAYAARAEVYDWYFFDWEKAEYDYHKALELNPNNASAHLYKALHLVAQRRYREAIAERSVAEELDPYSMLIRGNGYWIPMLGGHAEKSMEEIRTQMIHEQPNLITCFCRGLFASHLGLDQESVEYLREANRLGANTEFEIFSKIILAYGLARAHHHDEARELLIEIHLLEKTQFIWPMGIALAYAHLHETEKALQFLERAYDERVGWMLWIGCDPSLNILHHEPRFKELVKKIGPPEAIAEMSTWALPQTIEKSIVVLPFVNISNDPDQEYFSDGLTEEIIADLSRLNDLLVISRSSAMTFKSSIKKVKEIADDLNVQYVLEGSVRKSGNSLRITAQLIDARTDAHVWAEKYNGSLEDVFDIQEKVSRAIVGELKIHLSEKEDKGFSERPINNVAAYDCYLRARKELIQWNEEATDRALKYLENALSIVGPNPQLYAGLAYTYWSYANFGQNMDEYTRKTEEFVKKTFDLDPASPEAHIVLATVEIGFKGHPRQGVKHLKQALKLRPNDFDANMWLAVCYIVMGHPEKANPFATRMQQGDPLSAIVQAWPGLLDFYSGNFNAALEPYQKANVMEPENFFYTLSVALILCIEKNWIKASAFITAKVKDSNNHSNTFYKIMLYAIKKDVEKVNELLSPEFNQWCTRDFQWSHFLAQVFAVVEMKQKALEWFENSVNRGFCNYPLLSTKDPLHGLLKDEPAFQNLLIRMKKMWEEFE